MAKRKITLEQIEEEIGDYIYELLEWRVKESAYSDKVYEEILRNKRRLRNALKNCCQEEDSKVYVKSVIEQILYKKFRLDGETIDWLLPFETEQETGRDMFEYLIFLYQRRHGKKALSRILSEEEMHPEGAQITGKQLERLYGRKRYLKLEFEEKMDFLVQRIYSGYRGLGVIDILTDQAIDGISGGVSGQEAREESVWIFFQGESIHLAFLEFGSRNELVRVCRNLCRNHQMGELNQERGYLIRDFQNKSRVVVARPPFSENWVFFMRKFDGLTYRMPEDLLTDKNRELPLALLKWFVKGCQVLAITGAQGSGKTTLLMSLVSFIPEEYTLRIQESAFELNLRKTYPERNIVSFQETKTISGQEGLDFQKKTDGVVSLLGEVASPRLAALMIQLGQAASRYTLFTHHANTARDLVIWLRNSLLQAGSFQEERAALEQVLDVVKLDVHMAMKNGHRYIERITEIIPADTKEGFTENHLVTYKNGAYILTGYLSGKGRERIEANISEEEAQEFKKLFG